MMASSLRCTLVFPDDPFRPSYEPIPSDPANKNVFVNLKKEGVEISFPQQGDHGQTLYRPDHEPTDSMHRIMIALPPNGCVVRIQRLIAASNKTSLYHAATGQKIEDVWMTSIRFEKDRSPQIIGYETPYNGTNVTASNYINKSTLVCGVASLAQILQLTELILLVPGQLSHLSELVEPFKIRDKPDDVEWTYETGLDTVMAPLEADVLAVEANARAIRDRDVQRARETAPDCNLQRESVSAALDQLCLVQDKETDDSEDDNSHLREH